MSNETDNKEGAGGNDAAAKAVADKAAADAAAKAAGAGNGAGDGEKTITIKESELEKIKSDRDNYREGLLKKKADERSLGDKGKSENKSDGGTIDEMKVKEIAKAESAAVFAEVYKANESRAKHAFLKKYGEYVNDTQWMELMSHFTQRRSKAITEDILDDLEDAVLIHKRSTGKLEDHLKAESERARREGRIEGQMDAGRGGGADDKNESGKGTGSLSPKGEEMARAMHTDPEKVKKVDLSKDNVIDVNK